jgi:diadenosine tetraphosphatase ApaH/serine/threonine PP2A family protein phosphatase
MAETKHSSDMVERVATELETVWLYGQRDGVDLWRALSAKALEASHHAELVEEVARLRAENDRLSRAVCSGILGDLLAPDENEALLAFIRDVRAKIGGDA